MEKLNLSILIPAYNEERNITRLLQRVADSLLVTGLMSEVILLPNGCTDSTVQCATDFIRDRKDEKINWNLVVPDRIGKSHALNTGLETAKAEFVLDLDADCLPEERCIVKVFDELFNNQSIMLAGALDVPNFEVMDKSTLLYQYERTQQIWREERGRVIPVGGTMAYKRAAIDKFPENIHSEDTWLPCRFEKKFV